MAKIVGSNDLQYNIQPSYGYAFKMSQKIAGYKFRFWLGVFILSIGTFGCILWLSSLWSLGSLNPILFAVVAGGAFLVFYTPSQVMVNNNIWVNRNEYDNDVAKGVNVDEKYFRRYWT